MKWTMAKPILNIATICIMCAAVFQTTKASFSQTKKTIYYFYGENCPHCAKAEPIVHNLARRYNFSIEKFEVWYNEANRKKLLTMAAQRGKTVLGVPTIIVGNAIYTGSNETKIEEIIRKAR
ncbi:MAG: thioredoxin family protein [Spirochaetes bacterium]|nr:thioredoxin family protein [Spirochaetota bacterium]